MPMPCAQKQPDRNIGRCGLPARGSAKAQADVNFLLEAARTLASTGIPADCTEEILKNLARKLGLGLDCFATHTGLLLHFRLEDGTTVPGIVRSRADVMDLGRLARLNDLAVDLLRDRCPRPEALSRLRAITGRAKTGPAWHLCVAHAILSACVASFLNGGLRESLMGGIFGAAIGLGMVWGASWPSFARVLPCLGAVFTGVGSLLAGRWIGGFSPLIVTLAALIVLIPCQSMVMATNELATDHHLAGAARGIHSALELGQLATGMIIAECMGLRWFPQVMNTPPAAFPGWVPTLAIFLAAPTFVVILRGRWSDLPSILAACVLSFIFSGWAGSRVGPAFGAGLTSFCLGMGTVVWADLRGSSPFVPLLPAMVILAPGVSGLRGLTQIVSGQLRSGIDNTVRMGEVTIALLVGLLLSRMVLSLVPRPGERPGSQRQAGSTWPGHGKLRRQIIRVRLQARRS